MDLTTIFGLLVAFGAIIGGDLLEGGHIGALVQPTAAIIVMGGTIGACVVQFPGGTLKNTLGSVKTAFKPTAQKIDTIVQTIITLANKARREGLVAIGKETATIEDAFLKRGLELAVDGTESKDLRTALEMEITHVEEEGEGPIKVFEAAGGYAPTVGILGAVLGLIHVMENLSDPSKLGSGIAVAFVATVYGVGTANLLWLPLSGKLKARLKERTTTMEMIVEGVCGVASGENPRLIERKLSIYVHGKTEEGGAEGAGARAAAGA